MTRLRILVSLTVFVGMTLSGCSSITGLDASSSYNCKAPAGVRCDSVTGTYENAVRNNLPSQRPNGDASAHTESGQAVMRRPQLAASAQPPDAVAVASRSPTNAAEPQSLWAAPTIMRLWVNTWRDAEQDLNGESMVYLQVDDGRWLVGHAQQETRRAFAPVRAPAKSAAAPAVDVRLPLRPASGSSDSGEDSLGIGQALRALQQKRGATTPASEN